VSAAYGLETAAQVINDMDLQVLEAIQVIPRASQLAEKFKNSSK